MNIATLNNVKVSGKRVLLREDLNVPLDGTTVTDDTRIRAALPTIKKLSKAGARLLVVSHLGRPQEGAPDLALSLAPVAARLSELLGKPVKLVSNWLNGVDLTNGEVALAENVRFEVGEKKNDDELARKMAALCDVYVNDAFATAHRAEASTHGIAKYAPSVSAGPLLEAELAALRQIRDKPVRPLIAIVGGAKVSTKLEVLESLVGMVDQLIVGGGIATTFMKAAGLPIGKSLCENDLLDTAKRLIEQARTRAASIPMPLDVVCCAKEFSATAPATVKDVREVAADDLILDVGPQTAALYVDYLKKAETIIWNGPLGVFEFDQFGGGTKALAEGIAASEAYSVAGGGDTLAAIAKYGVTDKISYISTGGGAFLEYLEGKVLPAVAILQERSRANPHHYHPSEGY